MSDTRYNFVYAVAALLLFVPSAFSQTTPRIAISGRVLDDSTSAPLQNVDVFIAHTTMGSGTDQNGQFTIPDVPAGSYEIVASRVGYSMHSVSVTLSASEKKQFEIRLKPKAIQVGEVVISASDPSEWRDQLKKFTAFFLGKSKNARNCRILNPEVLDFSTGEGETFEATARSPLEIDNLALGYHLSFFLTVFRIKYTSSAFSERVPGVLTYEGLPRYTQLNATTADESTRWRENRLRAYRGSLRHFLAALVEGKVEQEGFVVYQIPYVAGVAISRYDPATGLHNSDNWRGDGWDPRRRSIREQDILHESGSAYERIVQFKGFLEVEYTRETLEPEYDSLVKRGTDTQVSWLGLRRDDITVNTRGIVKDWFFPTVKYGYWGWQRVADMLPLDYEPEN